MSLEVDDLLPVDVIRERLRNNLQADLVDYRVKRRSEWDGEGFDVVYDIVVLWRQPEEIEGKNWGYHSGVIRRTQGGPYTVEIFWGHYRREETQARKDYKEKRFL